MASYQVLTPTDEMDVSEFINGKEMTALSDGRVTITYKQTYAHIIQIFKVGKRRVECHLLACAGTRDVTVSAKKQWAEFKFTSTTFLANAACLRQCDKTVAN